MPREVSFTVGKDRLKGTLFDPRLSKPKNPAILFIHGWTSNRGRYQKLAQKLSDLGYVVLTFDMRGHGNSDGNIELQTRNDFIDDVIASYDFLSQQEGVDPRKISVVGSSLGSYLAAVLAGKRRTYTLVLRAPANYPNEGFEKPQYKHSNDVEILKWRYKVSNPNDTISLRALNDFNGEVLIVESGNDEVIPPQTVKNYINAVKDKKKVHHIVMPGAPHSLSESP